ncbi:RNA helicase [Actinoplanes sp. SE50]|uniref:ATP-dependent RNA helicase HrpA n=1 Tax=unclassified Actinoplanes TaxID=2626549 RepID=UPI00023ED65F|nr:MULTISPECIES: ATP-dependent RNA helicase HrpA [unclassified Actinoplanes]AEV86205.1 ATP-dependent helicase HrpA [Actinoplanes sp. SE50/110]ATO84603.1 RNA helicase [Actinoplanes sp. SE50]SLM02013.1 ATP-dependent helicase [Actinoplanes sp. SE50/110]
MSTSPSAPPAELRSRITQLLPRDEHRIGRRLEGTRRIRDDAAKSAALAEITAEVERAEARLASRAATVPPITYPEALPVSARKDDIAAAIRDHQVVVVAGETGSGKTTQIPKICLELGRGVRGQIGHTQPRRIAARTVAERIAEELDRPLGATVGYKVRFTDQAGEDTLVKVMTDGILLAEIQTDRMLRRYDTLIIDEAHERSLNIDFILGYLRDLLPKRPDLKLIITSATIETQRFAEHFADAAGQPAPVIEVSGRTYPVEVRYRPLITTQVIDDDEIREEPIDQIEGIAAAVDELPADGDILVFLSGEREIRDTADALTRKDLRNTEVVPLYGRLSAAEQHRVFERHTGRRIVLATNVAETSLTVPGIRYVIDPGTARISRYSSRLKVQRLPIEAVSQASANQRKGRCGRTSDGICIRLYSEEDFDGRPEFTEPEILRTNLASVILQMTNLGLGDLAKFPFIDPPDKRNITDGIKLLEELGALQDRKLTPIGRQLAQLPVDPRLARMVIEADRQECVAEVMVIAAALSIQDPRERPADRQQQADEKHSRFTDKESDFFTYLNLWRYLRQKQQELSGNQFRRLCRAEFLNYLRVREWQDIYAQLRQVVRTLELNFREDWESGVAPQPVHTALLAGLLSHIGLKDTDKREYLGARGAKFAIFPGSALFKRQPRWLMSAELVETSRLWARVNARIEPEWAEKLAPHLVKHSYSEPHWDRKMGAVMAFEKVTLYGLPIIPRRRVGYGKIDPVVARDLFIRHALVEGDWDTHHKFFEANRQLLRRITELENRARRRDIAVDDEAVHALYDARIPADIVSSRHFDGWWKKARHENPDLLTFTREDLVNAGRDTVDPNAFPDAWLAGGVKLPLLYEFEPNSHADGVTVRVPLDLINKIDADDFGWSVPGFRKDVVIALIRALPKALRTSFVPVPDWADAVLDRVPVRRGPLPDAIAGELRRLSGTIVPRDAWRPDQVPDHLRMNFRIVNEAGEVVAEGRDLDVLRRALAPKVQATISRAAGNLERTGITTNDFGAIPHRVAQQRGGYAVTVWPALVDEGASVGVKVFETEAEQRVAMRAGTRRLLLLTLPPAARFLQGRLDNRAKLELSRANPYRSIADLLDDCAGAAVDRLVADAGGPVWSSVEFASLRDTVREDLVDAVANVVTQVQAVLSTAYDVDQRIRQLKDPGLLPALADIRQQLKGLVYPGFVTETGWRQLHHLPRYLKAIAHRMDRLGGGVGRDRQLTTQIHEIETEYRELLAEAPPGGPAAEGLREIRWMLEELRVSFFAQSLGTAYPVSDKRIFKAMDALPL